LALAREPRCDAEASETDSASCRVHQHVRGLDVLADQPAFVEPTECAGKVHGESEELSDLHRLSDEAIKGILSSVVDHEHRLPGLAHQFERPQGQCNVQVRLKSVFVREAIDTFDGRTLGA
jgi:hypothetical protein